MKKFRRSPIAVICYVMAAITAAYFIAVIFSTMSTIHQYYAQYQMSAGFGETLGYLLQNGLSPLVSAITLFMAGFILEEVRKLNPSNWMTEEEIAEAKEAKKMAREAKKKADEMAAAEFSAVVAEGYDDEEDAEDAAVEVIEEEPAEADAEPEAADADEEAAAADVEEESEPAEVAQFSVVIEEDDTADDAAEEAPEDKETEEAPEDKETEEAPESKDTKKKRKRNKRRN